MARSDLYSELKGEVLNYLNISMIWSDIFNKITLAIVLTVDCMEGKEDKGGKKALSVRALYNPGGGTVMDRLRKSNEG